MKLKVLLSITALLAIIICSCESHPAHSITVSKLQLDTLDLCLLDLIFDSSNPKLRNIGEDTVYTISSKEELLKLYNSDLNELLNISSRYVKDEVEFCSLVNARSGKCSQNCKYCAQSSHYRTNIEEYPLISNKEIIKAANEAKENGVIRFAVVTSGKSPDEENFDKILSFIDELNKVEGIKSCASLALGQQIERKPL